MSELQKIVVLCVIVIGIIGGLVYFGPRVIPMMSETEPSLPVEIDVPPGEAVPGVSGEPNDLPVVVDGKVIDSFEDCAAAGYAVMESYPAKCRANGVLFTQSVPAHDVTGESPVACTADAKLCPDGSAVGRTGPNCEFAVCPGDIADDGMHMCSPEERATQICTKEYMPVCGLVEVQCVTTPCDPVPETFSNGCMACGSGNVTSYTAGACAGA